MSDKRYEANIIRATAVEPANNLQTTSAPGVWSIDEVVELQKKEKWPTVGNVITNVEDVFSNFLYEGNGSAQNINNGINLGNNIAGSVDFDGAGDSLESSSHSFAYGTGDFTVEFWAYFDGVSGTQNIFDNRSAASTGFMIGINSSSTMRFYWDSADRIADSATVSTGQWYHIAVARSSGTTKMFKNGTQIGSDYSDSNNYTSSVLEIGQRSTSDGLEFDGKLSNVRVVLGTALYTANFDAPTAPLTAISGTELLICTSNNLQDEGPNNVAFTVKGDPQVLSSSPFTGNTGEGGLVWVKQRDGGSSQHALFDTVNGTLKALATSSTAALATEASVTSFNSDGFSLGNFNNSGDPRAYVSWTFRKQNKFFDIVQYSGTGSAQAINHNLGSTPGAIFVKQTNESRDWAVLHRRFNGGGSYQNFWMKLNDQGELLDDNTVWNDTVPTSTQFTVGTGDYTNKSGGTYIAYLFAHNDNDGEFGPTQDQDIIKCGNYTGNGSSTYGTFQDLGFEPQWILVKNTDLTSEPWVLLDNMRGVTGNPSSNDPRLHANSANEEYFGQIMQFNATGFTPLTADDKINGSSHDYIYIAIRRGPMATPTAATDVFSLVSQAGGYQNNRKATTGFPVDLAINVQLSPGADKYLYDRKRGERKDLKTSQDHVEGSNSPGPVSFDFMDGVKHQLYNSANTVILSMWRRAPGYFDIVEWVGTGSARTLAHNLGVAPEMIWVKDRGRTQNWAVYHASNTSEPATERLRLNEDGATVDDSAYWNDTQPTSSVFTVGTDGDVNTSGESYIGYLFATLAGVSKVGSFVSDGNPQNIDCGFSSGARYILIKKSSGTFNWRVWDTTRGIVAGDDPYYYLDTDNANTTNGDWVDPYSSGFSITTAFSNGTYIFYAIA
jgi:hypothetical protein